MRRVVLVAILHLTRGDDTVDVDAVEAWALERREERIARWLPSQPFNRTGFKLVPLAPKLERGFLLAATRGPVEHLRKESDPKDELGAMLADVCACAESFKRVVHGDASRRRRGVQPYNHDGRVCCYASSKNQLK